MKAPELIRVLVVAGLAGLAAFGAARHWAAPSDLGDELSWLIAEFDLTTEQADKIKSLHEAYAPICAAHCEAIIAAREEVAAARDEEERADRVAQLIELEGVCHEATRRHLETVAAAMPPAEGQRYLQMIGPRVSAHQHAEPFGLQ